MDEESKPNSATRRKSSDGRNKQESKHRHARKADKKKSSTKPSPQPPPPPPTPPPTSPPLRATKSALKMSRNPDSQCDHEVIGPKSSVHWGSNPSTVFFEKHDFELFAIKSNEGSECPETEEDQIVITDECPRDDPFERLRRYQDGGAAADSRDSREPGGVRDGAPSDSSCFKEGSAAEARGAADDSASGVINLASSASSQLPLASDDRPAAVVTAWGALDSARNSETVLIPTTSSKPSCSSHVISDYSDEEGYGEEKRKVKD